jgi:hypothetical protein
MEDFNYNGATEIGRPHVLVALFLFRSGSFHFKDQYADYWALTQNHAKIMHQYSIANPKQWKVF